MERAKPLQVTVLYLVLAFGSVHLNVDLWTGTCFSYIPPVHLSSSYHDGPVLAFSFKGGGVDEGL